MPLEIGQTILDKYRVERMLGEGGFGYVYQAVDTSLQRRVAIKELKAELANDANALRRFQNEARAIAQLSNSCIVSVIDLKQAGAHHLMILEFMDGGNLAQLLSKQGRLLPNDAARIAKAVCDGLAAAHRLGIVHRDIKPANILLSRDGALVKLSDFGIAHVPSAVSNLADVTRVGTTMGTPKYMSPEQARGQKVDARSDVYSVGVMLYEMLAGYMYLDFTGDLLGDLEKLKTAPPRPMPTNTPKGLQQIVAKALAKDPNQRFQSAEEMAAALQSSVIPGRPITVSTPTGPTRVRPPTASNSVPWMIGITAIGILVAVLALAIIAILAIRSNPPGKPTSIALATPLARATDALPARPASEMQTDVARSIFATQTVQAQAVQAQETTMAADVSASLTAAVPTRTRTPMPTLPPTATRTPVPTSTPTPTPVPTPTPTPIPALTFLGIEWEPNPPPTGVNITFFAKFNNTFPEPRWIEWTVQLRDVDQNQRWQNAWTFRRQTNTIPPGVSRLPVNTNETWHISKNERIKNFMARVVYMREDKNITEILKTPSGIDEFPLQLTAQ